MPARARVITVLDLNDEQRAIQEAAKQFLAAKYKPERIRELIELPDGFAEEDWQEMTELGWQGLALPEEWGGQGLGMVELAVVMEEMGYALAPSPLLSNTVAGLVLATCADDDQKERYLRPLAAGERRGTPALFDAGTPAAIGEFAMEAGGERRGRRPRRREGAGDGRRQRRLLPRRDQRRAQAPRRPRRGRGQRLPGELDRPHPQAVHGPLRGGRGPGRQTPSRPRPRDYMPVFQRGCVALSAELTGIAQRTMEMAVAYAKDREQFGRAIGSYQAVSHSCAQMLLETENSRSAVYFAAWAADAEPETLPRAASIAKAYASDAGWRVAAASMQVHGGIGFTWEHDLHFWLKRARADASMFGDAKWHRDQVAEAVLAA